MVTENSLQRQPTVRAVSPRREAAFTIASVGILILILVNVFLHLIRVGESEWSRGELGPRLTFVAFVVVFAALLYGALVFLLSRLGYYVRLSRFDARRHEPDLSAPDADLFRPLAVLVPSYKEDVETIRQTVLSAALQDYPDRRVVILLDDPPYPASDEDRRLLDSARRVPEEVQAMLESPRRRALAAQSAFAGRARNEFSPAREAEFLARAFYEAADWFARQASGVDDASHVDRLFGSLVFGDHGAELRSAAMKFRAAAIDVPLTHSDVELHYRRLVQQFTVTISSFERKRYVNLSQESNKASNLNAYIDLLGKTVREVTVADGGLHLEEVAAGTTGSWTVPTVEYVATLDADSLLSFGYARRLVKVMETPGNDRMAVAQTPYSAIPGAPSVIERVAGATTDVQFNLHQGYTWLGATFWVGANALLRMTALQDIRTVENERGFVVPKYIQDRTVIEDTESSIDLVARGWALHNEPIRLAYSATPPDFGALLIQRRRWANGGLLILPKLLRHALSRNSSRFGIMEMLVRIQYLVSPALASTGLLLLLMLPVSQSYLNPWLAAAGVPYFALYWRDTFLSGYRRSDILRVYAFNWLLVPINLAGVGKSIQQGITRQKIPFGRTPKVTGRTAAPSWAIISLWLLLLYTIAGAAFNAVQGNWLVFAFSASTVLALGYALVTFIGVRESLEDIQQIWRGTAGISRQR